MAKLIDGVNEVLKRVQIIQGSTGELSTLTSSSIQVYIDLSVQVWNEILDEVYSQSGQSKPKELVENTITLVADDRDYALDSQLVQLHWPLIDETNGQYIQEYKGGYDQMWRDQLFPDSYTGLPYYAAIRTTDGELYLDRIPTSAEAGNVYKYRYDKDVELVSANSVMPFNDAVFRALVPAVAELWRYYQHNQFASDVFSASLARAIKFLNKVQQNESWLTS